MTVPTNARQAYFGRNMTSIVIIEHNDLMRDLLKEWLTESGYDVRTRTLHEALANDHADLVIVDVRMPRHAGAVIVSALQRAHPNTPVIAMSGRFRAGLGASSSAARAFDARKLLAKPFTRDELLTAVRAAIGERR
jgi:DNA-binding NtrC family response regulator